MDGVLPLVAGWSGRSKVTSSICLLLWWVQLERWDQLGLSFHIVSVGSWTSFLSAQGSKCKCFERWEVVTVSLLGLGLKLAQISCTVFCWLTESHSRHGPKGGDIDSTSLWKECQRIWNHFKFATYVRMYMFFLSFFGLWGKWEFLIKKSQVLSCIYQ